MAAQITSTGVTQTITQDHLVLKQLCIRAIRDIAHLKTSRRCVRDAVRVRRVIRPAAAGNIGLLRRRVVARPPRTCVVGTGVLVLVGLATGAGGGVVPLGDTHVEV